MSTFAAATAGPAEDGAGAADLVLD
jgi:hypothetical protein